MKIEFNSEVMFNMEEDKDFLEQYDPISLLLSDHLNLPKEKIDEIAKFSNELGNRKKGTKFKITFEEIQEG